MISLLLAQQHDEPLNGTTYTAVVERERLAVLLGTWRCFARRAAGHIVWSESVSPYCWAQSLARRAAAWDESVSPCCWSHRVVPWLKKNTIKLGRVSPLFPVVSVPSHHTRLALV